MALHLNKFQSLSSKDALCQVSMKLYNLKLWFLRIRFLKLVNAFLLFPYYLSFEKGGVLHLNKLESSSPKYALSEVSLKLAMWILRKKILKIVKVFSLFRYDLPLEKGVAPILNKLECPLPKDAWCRFG